MDNNHVSNFKNDSDIIQMYKNIKHEVFPRPFERLAVTGSNLIGVEIGVYKGDHAESILKTLDIKMLYLVDPYNINNDNVVNNKIHPNDWDSIQMAKNEAEKKLSPYNDRITWIIKNSDDAVNYIPDNLDFVYIDGNHASDFVRKDIYNYFGKIKQSGVIGGHDFYNGYCRAHDGVVSEVSKFAVLACLDLKVEMPDWWCNVKL